MFACHRFAKRMTAAEHQKWADEHREELLADILKRLPETLEQVKKLEDAKKVSPGNPMITAHAQPGKEMTVHMQPMNEAQGQFDAWRPTKPENPAFKCRRCGSDEIYYRAWESDCGGHEDIQYHCRACDRKWWVEGADA